MATDLAVESALKFREGKKWKKRRCVLRKLSPVADCLQCCFYATDWRHSIDKSNTAVMLEHFCGIDVSQTAIDREMFVMSVICRDRTLTFAFHNDQTLAAWRTIMNKHLGEDVRFDATFLKVQPSSSPAVTSPSSSVAPGPVLLFVRGSYLTMASAPTCSGSNFIASRCLAYWNVELLRRFGVQNGKFCFEVPEQRGGANVYIFDSPAVTALNRLLLERTEVQSAGRRNSSMSIASSTGKLYQSESTLCTSTASSALSSSERTLCPSDSVQTLTTVGYSVTSAIKYASLDLSRLHNGLHTGRSSTALSSRATDDSENSLQSSVRSLGTSHRKSAQSFLTKSRPIVVPPPRSSADSNYDDIQRRSALGSTEDMTGSAGRRQMQPIGRPPPPLTRPTNRKSAGSLSTNHKRSSQIPQPTTSPRRSVDNVPLTLSQKAIQRVSASRANYVNMTPGGFYVSSYENPSYQYYIHRQQTLMECSAECDDHDYSGSSFIMDSAPPPLPLSSPPTAAPLFAPRHFSDPTETAHDAEQNAINRYYSCSDILAACLRHITAKATSLDHCNENDQSAELKRSARKPAVQLELAYARDKLAKETILGICCSEAAEKKKAATAASMWKARSLENVLLHGCRANTSASFAVDEDEKVFLENSENSVNVTNNANTATHVESIGDRLDRVGLESTGNIEVVEQKRNIAEREKSNGAVTTVKSTDPVVSAYNASSPTHQLPPAIRIASAPAVPYHEPHSKILSHRDQSTTGDDPSWIQNPRKPLPYVPLEYYDGLARPDTHDPYIKASHFPACDTTGDARRQWNVNKSGPEACIHVTPTRPAISADVSTSPRQSSRLASNQVHLNEARNNLYGASVIRASEHSARDQAILNSSGSETPRQHGHCDKSGNPNANETPLHASLKRTTVSGFSNTDAAPSAPQSRPRAGYTELRLCRSGTTVDDTRESAQRHTGKMLANGGRKKATPSPMPSDYLPMSGKNQNRINMVVHDLGKSSKGVVDEDDCEIFCAVNLPMTKKTSSSSWSRSVQKGGNMGGIRPAVGSGVLIGGIATSSGSTSSTTAADAEVIDKEPARTKVSLAGCTGSDYLDMTIKNLPSRDGTLHRTQPGKLHQSHSLGNNLDETECANYTAQTQNTTTIKSTVVAQSMNKSLSFSNGKPDREKTVPEKTAVPEAVNQIIPEHSKLPDCSKHSVSDNSQAPSAAIKCGVTSVDPATGSMSDAEDYMAMDYMPMTLPPSSGVGRSATMSPPMRQSIRNNFDSMKFFQSIGLSQHHHSQPSLDSRRSGGGEGQIGGVMRGNAGQDCAADEIGVNSLSTASILTAGATSDSGRGSEPTGTPPKKRANLLSRLLRRASSSARDRLSFRGKSMRASNTMVGGTVEEGCDTIDQLPTGRVLTTHASSPAFLDQPEGLPLGSTPLALTQFMGTESRLDRVVFGRDGGRLPRASLGNLTTHRDPLTNSWENLGPPPPIPVKNPEASPDTFAHSSVLRSAGSIKPTVGGAGDKPMVVADGGSAEVGECPGSSNVIISGPVVLPQQALISIFEEDSASSSSSAEPLQLSPAVKSPAIPTGPLLASSLPHSSISSTGDDQVTQLGPASATNILLGSASVSPVGVSQPAPVKSRKPNLTVDLTDLSKMEGSGATSSLAASGSPARKELCRRATVASSAEWGAGKARSLRGGGGIGGGGSKDSTSLVLGGGGLGGVRVSRDSESSSEDKRSLTSQFVINTQRPRSGKEYQVLNRRQLIASDDAMSGSLFFTPQPSPFLASFAQGSTAQHSPCSAATYNSSGRVFTFETPSSSHNCSYSSGDESSPRFQGGSTRASLSLRGAPLHTPFRMNTDGSPTTMILNDNPRSSCPSSTESARRQHQRSNDPAMLNYADIDLSDSSHSPRTPRGFPPRGGTSIDQSVTDYTELDLIATAAAAQTGRQHALSRERQYNAVNKHMVMKSEPVATSASLLHPISSASVRIKEHVLPPSEVERSGGKQLHRKSSSSSGAERRTGGGFTAGIAEAGPSRTDAIANILRDHANFSSNT